MNPLPESYLGQAGSSLFAVKTTLRGLPDASSNTSRRRRIWEMCGTAQCPVVGVCLPMSQVKKLTQKYLGHAPNATDYEIHCSAVVACKNKSAFAKVIQEELNARYAPFIQRTQSLKTREALLGYWSAEQDSLDFAGVFWAVISHPKCDAAFEFEVLGHAHMLQHQAGCERLSHALKLEALEKQHQDALCKLEQIRQKYQAAQESHANLEKQWREQVSIHQTQLVQRDATISRLEQQIETFNTPKKSVLQLQDMLDTYQARDERLKQSIVEKDLRIAALEKQLLQQNQSTNAANTWQIITPPRPLQQESSTKTLNDRSILCVGGRPSSVPVYKETVETRGGRFIHHDGGQEEGLPQLEAKLNGADLVICQAACISHEAYFKVKEHCKRFGIQCVYVNNPSKSALKRALAHVNPTGIAVA